MAKLSTDDYKITINGTNYSDHLAGVSIPLEAATYKSTAFGMGWDEYIKSPIKGGSLTLKFHNDYGASSIDSVLFPFLTGTSNATVVATPTSASVSATNPAYTVVAVPSQYSPVSGDLGNLATVDVTWPIHGTVARGTA